MRGWGEWEDGRGWMSGSDERIYTIITMIDLIEKYVILYSLHTLLAQSTWTVRESVMRGCI